MTTVPPRRIRYDLLAGGLLGAVVIVATLVLRSFGPASPATCQATVDLNVTSSTEKSTLMQTLADRYERADRVVDDQGTCVGNVAVFGLTSGKAKIELAEGWRAEEEDLPPRPQVWLPTSSLWLDLLKEEGKGELIAGDEPTSSVASSVLVIATPRSVADTLRAAGKPLDTWARIRDLAQSPAGWADYGRPEWGDFLLARDNPDVSTSGMATTVAIYYAAPGEPSLPALDDEAVFDFVHDIESSVTKYGDEAVQFMGEIFVEEQKRDSERDRPYIDAVAVQEQMVYAYNCGSPTADPAELNCDQNLASPLAVVHPRDGTVKLDHPFAVLSSATAAQRAAADDFREFLLEDEQQRDFRDIGFRPPDRATAPTDQLVEVLGLPKNQRLEFVGPPDATLLDRLLDSWTNVKKKARVLLVLDVSGSMNAVVNDPDTAEDSTKLGLMKPAVAEALDLLGGDDEVGLWTFSSSYQEVVPISPVSEVRDELELEIDALTAAGDTALYQVTEQAHDTMVANLDPERINAVVLLSDGKNTEPYGGGLQALRDRLNPDGRDTSVRIFTIPYGNDEVPVRGLADISRLTRATQYDASDPLDIKAAFVDVFQNFGTA